MNNSLNDQLKLISDTRNHKYNQTGYDLIEILLGLSSEVGEIQDLYKKNLYSKGDLYISLKGQQLKEEIGDLMYYVQALCRYEGIKLSEAINDNIKKVKEKEGVK